MKYYKSGCFVLKIAFAGLHGWHGLGGCFLGVLEFATSQRAQLASLLWACVTTLHQQWRGLVKDRAKGRGWCCCCRCIRVALPSPSLPWLSAVPTNLRPRSPTNTPSLPSLWRVCSSPFPCQPVSVRTRMGGLCTTTNSFGVGSERQSIGEDARSASFLHCCGAVGVRDC